MATPQSPTRAYLASPSLSHYKNTIIALFFTVLLGFSLFSPLQASSNTNLSQIKTAYSAKLLISRNSGNPIAQARFYRNGIIFSSLGQLYFNNEKIDLLNSNNNEFGMQINDIYIDNKDFYLATDIGVFQNYRRIFSKEPCNHIVKTSKQIFIACARGIYSSPVDKKTLQTNFKWKLDEHSPQNANFITLNKSNTHLAYASAVNGFYYHNSRKHKWINRSYGLKRDFQDSFGFGRFYVDRTAKDQERIYLATSSGIFISDNSGQSWVKNNTGLRSNPDGFYSPRQIIRDQDRLILITSNGLYYSQIAKYLSWQTIEIEHAKTSSNSSPDYYSIDILNNKKLGKQILVSNSQGQIFELTDSIAKGAVAININREAKQSPNIIQKVLKAEPPIQAVHQKALEFAGIPTGKKFRAYKRQARLRNLIPDFEAFVDRDSQDILSIQTEASDSFNSSSSSINSDFDEVNLGRSDNEVNAGIRFSWDLSNLIYDPEINDINTTARITANIRENILTEITQIYYARKELIYQLLNQLQVKQPPEFWQNKLKLEEYTAQLDARTGAWFSQELEKRLLSKLERSFNPSERERILAIYI